MFTAQFVTNRNDGTPRARIHEQEFPTAADAFHFLGLIADESTEYIVNLTDPDGRWAGQYRTGNGHRDFPQN